MENRRAHVRFEVAVAAEITLDGDTLTAATRDISEGGVAAMLPDPLPEGRSVSLLLILTQDGIEDADEEPFETAATVMWSAPTEQGHALVGLRFANVQPAQRQQLQRFLAAMRSR
jgi:c-di-GMP-binding flagellar brake protein YcgR